MDEVGSSPLRRAWALTLLPLPSLPRAGPGHVAFRKPVPLSLHVHGRGGGRLLGSRLQFRAPPPVPEPEHHAPAAALQPLLHPRAGAGQQQPAHHRPAVHGRSPGAPRWQGRRPGRQPGLGGRGLRLGTQQPLLHALLQLRVLVAQTLPGEGGGHQRTAEHTAAGQRLGSQARQVPQRIPVNPSPEKSLHSSPVQSAVHFVGCQINHGRAVRSALLCEALSGKGCRTPWRECARNKPFLLGVVYTSGIWLRNVGCTELLGVGVNALAAGAPPSRLVWKLWEDRGSQAPGGEGLKSSPSADLYIYIFFLHRVKWKQIKLKKKYRGQMDTLI